MKASEAKALSDKNLIQKTEEELRPIWLKIIKAIERGCYCISVPTLTLEANTHLKNLGYEVKYHSDQRDNTSSYTISWNK